jgi:probable H4MPT-linked C1 transfer pathway protein
MYSVIGWDIGGVNTKVARVSGGAVCAVRGRPYELQRDPAALVGVLRELCVEVSGPPEGGPHPGGALGSHLGGDGRPHVTHAVTMTAELSQLFRTKREGVTCVLDAVESAFPDVPVVVFSVDGRFLEPDAARSQPTEVAAANWAATARVVAAHHPDALLIDIGTTSTDIIPIVGGAVVAIGRTDPERLRSGELLYTGALRTPVEALVSCVPFGGDAAGVSAEGFALVGDVHLWRGDLEPADYTVPTPDGRPATREFAGERLARVVCADREMVDAGALTAIADAVATEQIARLVQAITTVCGRHPSLRTAVVTGLGAFIAERAARMAGLEVTPLATELGQAAALCAPAASVGLLYDRLLSDRLLSERFSGA